MDIHELHEAAQALHEFARELHGTAARMHTEGMRRVFSERAARLERTAHTLLCEGLRVRADSRTVRT
jgi:hypothetical protein